ncbi:MAG: phenylalanine--tRNA ligase subunit beta [Planctomycetota bacterium]|jgi:phenylalanyl-tRNA synthetase beta chain|nr:phenylalanine--tRNA ligase subunit beta [Planctomycetota bacterium]
MKISYKWVQDYCDFQGSPQDLEELLPNLGMEVEETIEIGEDVCFDLEITSNRNDLNGVIGVAREISCASGGELKIPEIGLKGSDEQAADFTSIDNQAPDLCPRYTARIITGVAIGPSPDWMISRLETVGLRSINNVVDITNFVLLEACQPLHAFDYETLDENRIVIRRGQDGESITSIDGTECKLTKEMLAIADASRAVAIAGVMGGLDTEVTESTKTILLESADFNGVSIRRTARGLGLTTDSSFRFERGVDPVGVEWASRRAAALIEELAGGTTVDGILDDWPGQKDPAKVSIRVPEVHRLLGDEIPGEKIKTILTSLSLDLTEGDADALTFEIPSFRKDLEREIDLIEEVSRVHGFNNIPTASNLPVTSAEYPTGERVADVVHQVMTGSGFDEIITVSFQSDEMAEGVSPWSNGTPLVNQNPVRKQEAVLRRSLIPSLMQVRQGNEGRSFNETFMYEIASVYLSGEKAEDNEEKRVLTFIHGLDFAETKGVIEQLTERLRIGDDTVISPAESSFLEKGTGAVWKAGQRVLGYLGTASRSLSDKFDLREAPSIAEIDLDALEEMASFGVSVTPLPRYPASDRDVAVIIPEEVTWEQVTQLVETLELPDLQSIEFFDLYRGKGIEKGKKSLAFRVVFQSAERTLTNEEVNEHRDAIIVRLGEQFGAVLR